MFVFRNIFYTEPIRFDIILDEFDRFANLNICSILQENFCFGRRDRIDGVQLGSVIRVSFIVFRSTLNIISHFELVLITEDLGIIEVRVHAYAFTISIHVTFNIANDILTRFNRCPAVFFYDFIRFRSYSYRLRCFTVLKFKDNTFT